MKNVQLSASPLYKLGNFEFFQFVQTQIDRIRDLGDNQLTDDQLKAIIATMLGLLTDLNRVLARIRRSAVTGEITSLDQTRDTSVRALMRALKAHELSVDPTILRAVTEIETLLKPYGNVPRLTLEAETKAIDSMVERLESPRYATLVNTLGLGSYVSRLKTDNAEFKARYDRRTADYIDKDTTDTRELRSKITEHYSLLCDYVEVMTRMETKPLFGKVFAILDTIRTQYAAQQGRSADRKPNPNENS